MKYNDTGNEAGRKRQKLDNRNGPQSQRRVRGKALRRDSKARRRHWLIEVAVFLANAFRPSQFAPRHYVSGSAERIRATIRNAAVCAKNGSVRQAEKGAFASIHTHKRAG